VVPAPDNPLVNVRLAWVSRPRGFFAAVLTHLSRLAQSALPAVSPPQPVQPAAESEGRMVPAMLFGSPQASFPSILYHGRLGRTPVVVAAFPPFAWNVV
jgi:hypothetical protein